MTENLQASFERCCRLCAEEQDVTIMIFSKEAESMLLQNKMNKYLLIEVDEDDKLPKNICLQCCSKLQIVCDFIDTARKAQDVLLDRSLMLDDVISSNGFLKPIKEEYKSDEDVAERDEDVADEHLANEDVADEDVADDEHNKVFTEMEVSVDPMVVLQNCEEPTSPIQEDSVTMEDVTYLHGVDAENVTIKLIKKKEKVNKEPQPQPQAQPQPQPQPQGQPQAQPKVIEGETNDESKPFSCKTCSRSFLTDLALRSHTWQHNYESNASMSIFERYTCNTCLETFMCKNDLVIHLKTHRDVGKCQLCARVFRTEKNYVAHMSVHLPANKSYTCKMCSRSYNTWGALKAHSISHSSERPYQCQYCKKTFKRNQDLKFHINQHTGAKPYKCPFCDKCFASSGNCYSHRNRMHPGKRVETERSKAKKLNGTREPITPRPIAPKPAPKSTLTVVKGMYKYVCEHCNASFVKRDNYTYHMYQHTGEKPFQCGVCPHKFVTRRGLLIHHNKEHPGQNRPLALLTKNVLLK